MEPSDTQSAAETPPIEPVAVTEDGATPQAIRVSACLASLRRYMRLWPLNPFLAGCLGTHAVTGTFSPTQLTNLERQFAKVDWVWLEEFTKQGDIFEGALQRCMIRANSKDEDQKFDAHAKGLIEDVAERFYATRLPPTRRQFASILGISAN